MKNQSVVHIIESKLREEIINGKLLPGEQLIEVDLAEKYKISRNSVREILHLLVHDGLASAIRFKGVFVRVFYEKDLRDIYVARQVIQLQAIRNGQFTPKLLEELKTVIQQAQQALENREVTQVGTLSLLFHQLLVSALNNPLINNFFLNISAQLRLIFNSGQNEEEVQKAQWVEWEDVIYQHLLKQNIGQAEAELQHYLAYSEQVLKCIVSKTDH